MAERRTRAEESLALMKEVCALLDEPGCCISFSPAKSGNFMMYCERRFYWRALRRRAVTWSIRRRPQSCSVAQSRSTAAIQAKRSTRCLPVPLDMAKEVLRLTKLETLSWKEYVYDIAAVSVGAAVLEDFYDENAVFLRFCHEKRFVERARARRTRAYRADIFHQTRPHRRRTEIF